MAKFKPILAIDPGRQKCGLAIVEQEHVKLSEVVLREQLMPRIKQILPSSGPIVLGDGTGSQEFKQELLRNFSNLKPRLILIDEHLSTVEARALYWKAHPPKGWRKILPVSLQTPPVAIDDYVAIILAKRYQKMLLETEREFIK